jgi:ABC-2 type transport system permease protein
MRREGSPWQGLGVVFLKELSDHLSTVRMIVLQLMLVIIAGATVAAASAQLALTTAEDPYLYLRLLTITSDRIPIPPLVQFVGFLVPIMAIGLGFDAINGEHNRRTLSRILAQPIYRDALLFGKFLAALTTIAISLLVLWLLVIGIGLLWLGLPPGGEEMARAFVFLLVTIAYAGVWLALAMLFSIVFRSAATAALVALGVWIFFAVIWPAWFSPALAGIIAPPDPRYEALGFPTPETVEAQTIIARLSPSTLYGELIAALLNPATRALGPIYMSQLQGAVVGALPLQESLVMAWPNIVGLIAGTIVLFVIGYVVFQRQEVRA